MKMGAVRSPICTEHTMRIRCPNCGERDQREFSYLGDASVTRPAPGAAAPQEAFHAYVYLRANPAGPHREFWYHAAGCHAWLVVTRNTITHDIADAQRAGEAAAAAETARS
jgi:methylglutamate dehydrogenase subunit B